MVLCVINFHQIRDMIKKFQLTEILNILNFIIHISISRFHMANKCISFNGFVDEKLVIAFLFKRGQFIIPVQ
jgi:hypothetical protein